MILQDGFRGQGCGLRLHGEELLRLHAQGGGKLLCLCQPDRLAPASGGDGGGRDTSLLCQGVPGELPGLQKGSQVLLGHGILADAADAGLAQLRIEGVQVSGPELCQLDMPDGLVNPGKEALVGNDGPMLGAGALLGVDNVAAILRDRVLGVHDEALLNLPLKVQSGLPDGLLHLALRHAGLRLPGPIVTDRLAGDINSVGDGDLVGDAGLAVNLPNVRHCGIPPCGCRKVCSLYQTPDQ